MSRDHRPRAARRARRPEAGRTAASSTACSEHGPGAATGPTASAPRSSAR
ncbi:MAG: hypothetical protein M0C28_46670 [Candidatus Moduliflexus flocculans]|nr:hypothetical protein [Candidatus Moduliflexus flocculans]